MPPRIDNKLPNIAKPVCRLCHDKVTDFSAKSNDFYVKLISNPQKKTILSTFTHFAAQNKTNSENHSYLSFL